MLIFDPGNLALVKAELFNIISENREPYRLLGLPWRDVKVSTNRTDILEYGDSPLVVGQERDAFRLAEAVSANSVSASQFQELFSRHAAQLGVSDRECEKDSPRRQLRNLGAR